jgi:hypothetical protein
MDKYEGVPYGLFLGPKVSKRVVPIINLVLALSVISTRVAVVSFLQELEEVGGVEELEKELARIGRSI